MPISADARNGWELYNVQREFMRMGVGVRTKAWRLTDINKDYSFAPTYPAKLVVPARIGDATLTYAGKYRSKARIPTLSYLHWSNYGTITRCSQPLVGIKQNRSIQDEKLVEAIFQSHLSVESAYTVAMPESDSQSTSPEKPVYGATCMNVIIDARPTANAMANVAQGGGSENMDHYKGGGITRKAYLGIDNIHVMRDSLAKLVEVLRESDIPGELAVDSTTLDISDGASAVDRHALRRTGWIKHLSSIIQGVLIVVRTVHIASSHVLVHCSDGWDRTAQITALAQLCLDPYYRTLRGFMVLIEKEWCSFGHKFLDRCGHLSSERFFTGGTSAAERAAEAGEEGAGGAGAFIAGFRDRLSNPAHIKEMSPVFHQFLECARNIQRQYPDRFEFNEEFLRKLHWHLYACEFGTFVFNCERERRISLDGASSWSGIHKTKSVWEWFLSEENMRDAKWINPSYDKNLDDIKGGAGDMGVLLPNSKDVRFWSELYGRADEEMNGKIGAPAPTSEPELKVVEENSEDTPMARGVAKAMGDLTLNKDGEPSAPTSRNGTPALTSSLSSSVSGTRPSSALGGTSRETSPAIPSSIDVTPVITDLRPSAPAQADSFRPFTASASAFSLRSSPVPSSRPVHSLSSSIPPTPSETLPSTSANPYSSVYERPPAPTVRGNTQPQNYGMPGFMSGSFSDGITGFATNAGGGVRSMWGRLSSNASAAFSVVQDATRDFRASGSTPTSSGSEPFTRYGGSGSGSSSITDGRGGGSALGWGQSLAPATSSPATITGPSPWSVNARTETNVNTIRPQPRLGSLGIQDLASNPWNTPSQTKSNTNRTRTLEDEWESNTRASTTKINSSTATGIPIAAPVPRHAPNSTLPTSPALSDAFTDKSGHTTPQPPLAPREDARSDPLGVGL
ncbi:hypothetical protein FRC17_000767 [Serendipita sp. 399]|nr:hypothetical protein FRC17_000767 [Serendipita sp. 399]